LEAKLQIVGILGTEPPGTLSLEQLKLFEILSTDPDVKDVMRILKNRKGGDYYGPTRQRESNTSDMED
jgi:hypothetical protein